MNLKDIFPKASASFLKANATALNGIAPQIIAADKQFAATDSIKPKPRIIRRTMNATERGYSLILEALRRRGEIEDWKFESVKLRISDRCFYTPDFLVEYPGLKPLFIECKGAYIHEDARVKFLAAKELHKWADFEMHRRTRDGWQRIL